MYVLPENAEDFVIMRSFGDTSAYRIVGSFWRSCKAFPPTASAMNAANVMTAFIIL